MSVLLCRCFCVSGERLQQANDRQALVGLSRDIFRSLAFFGTDVLTGSCALLLRIHVGVNCFQKNQQLENRPVH